MSEEKKESSIGAKAGAVFGWLVTAVACGAAGWVGHDLFKACASAPAAGPMQMPPATVAVTNVQEMAYNLAEKFVAHAEPIQEVDLLPQVDGYIKEIFFKEGDIVKKGQLLYTLDDERYAAIVNQRKADLAAAEAEADRTHRYRERMEKADARGITQQEKDNAISDDMRAKAGVLQAKANLIVAEYDLNHAKVFAPIDGQIGKTSAHIGDYVAPTKGSLARIVQVDPIRVTFPLTDRQYIAWRTASLTGDKAKLNRRMRLVLPDGSEYKGGEGTFDFDDNTMNANTATITMRLSFPNPDRLLVPNTYITLLSDSHVPPKYKCVPQTAVIDLPGGNVGVWVFDSKTSQVTAVNVKTLETYNGWVPVIDGLKGDEIVVISGTSKLNNGAKVIPVTPTPNEEISADYQSYDAKEKAESK